MNRSANDFRHLLAAEQITAAPWLLSLRSPGRDEAWEKKVNDDFAEMSVEDFVKWLRDAIGHGDGRTIRPLHKHDRPAYATWLTGFQIDFPATINSKRLLHLCLYDADMRRIGSLLADRFCEALSQAPTYYVEDVATGVIEIERAA